MTSASWPILRAFIKNNQPHLYNTSAAWCGDINWNKQEIDQKTWKGYLGNEICIAGFEKLKHIPGNKESMCGVMCIPKKYMRNTKSLISGCPWVSAQAGSEGGHRFSKRLPECRRHAPTYTQSPSAKTWASRRMNNNLKHKVNWEYSVWRSESKGIKKNEQSFKSLWDAIKHTKKTHNESTT